MLEALASHPGVTERPTPPTRAPTGQARGLVYRVGNANLIDGVDLNLPPDTLTVLMGPNGAGKSLLLRLLHGMLVPTTGTVLWDGRPLGEAQRRHQAMVFQRPVLLRRSAAANIRFVLAGPRRERRERALAMLAQVGLRDLAHKPARLLSGGEQQRLSLARALALEPDILFLDEPTASLDPASTSAIEKVVRDARRGGTKVIFVTHDVGQARRLADDVVFLNRGRVTEHTPAGQFFARPATRAAGDYLAGRLILR